MVVKIPRKNDTPAGKSKIRPVSLQRLLKRQPWLIFAIITPGMARWPDAGMASRAGLMTFYFDVAACFSRRDKRCHSHDGRGCGDAVGQI